MKKPQKLLTAVVLAVLMLVASVCTPFAEGRGVVVTDLLNVRVSAGAEAQVAGRLQLGTEVGIIDTKDDWYQITYGEGDTGWVVADYIKADFDVVQATSDGVNVRKSPSVDDQVIAQINKFDRFIMVGRFNDWFKIKLQNGDTGWVNDQYAIITGQISRGVQDGEDARSHDTIRNVNEPVKAAVKMAIKGNNVNFREKPDLDSQIVLTLDNDDVVTVMEGMGEWRRVKTSGGTVGYINKMFLKEIKPVQTPVTGSADSSGKTVISKGGSGSSSSGSSKSSSSSGSSGGGGSASAGSSLIAYAKQFMGIRYKWGGTTTKGFDCSGFTQYVMRHFGANIARVSRDQAQGGSAVSKENLRVGDLVFFAKSASNRTINHVGIYIGSGNFIHSSSGGGGKGVTISNLNSGSYSKRYVCARRYLKKVP